MFRVRLVSGTAIYATTKRRRVGKEKSKQATQLDCSVEGERHDVADARFNRAKREVSTGLGSLAALVFFSPAHHRLNQSTREQWEVKARIKGDHVHKRRGSGKQQTPRKNSRFKLVSTRCRVERAISNSYEPAKQVEE